MRLLALAKQWALLTAAPIGAASVARGDHERRDVLAVVPHRTGTLAVFERERPVTTGGEERRGVVQRALADHRAGQRVGVRVPLDLEHPVGARIAAPALERRRSDGCLDLGQLDIVRLADRTQHACNITIAPDQQVCKSDGFQVSRDFEWS